MEETTSEKRGKSTSLIWLLVLVAILIIYWWFRPETAKHEVAAVPDVTTEGADPDDILVDLKDDVTPDQVAAIDRDLGIDLQLVADPESKGEQLYRAHVTNEADVLARLAKNPEVEIAEPDSYMAIPPGEDAIVQDDVDGADAGWPNDPQYKWQWHMRQIGMPDAWKLGADGKGVVVAVIDTGVAYENYGKYHEVEDLAGATFVDPYDFVNNKPHANDDHAHGTHVAGTIAQRTNNGIGVAGVAYNATIMPLKVLGGDGRGSVAGIADAIRWAADHHADVINMSLGGPFPSRLMGKAIEYAHAKGVVIVAAAGNESRSKVGYPAAYPGVIAVSATQEDEATTFYSNYGKDVDIAGPGGNTRAGAHGGVLQNTIAVQKPGESGYFEFMGTSMASPHVAGVAALVVQQGIHNPDEVEKILEETARQPSGQNKYERDRYGAGIVDAPAAVKKARAEADSMTASSTTHEVEQGGAAVGIALLLAGAIAAGTRRRSVRLGMGYLGGVVAGVASVFVLANALVPLAALSLGHGVRKLRAPLAGVAAGVGGHLLLLFAGGFSSMWLAGNALVCIVLARAAIKK